MCFLKIVLKVGWFNKHLPLQAFFLIFFPQYEQNFEISTNIIKENSFVVLPPFTLRKILRFFASFGYKDFFLKI